MDTQEFLEPENCGCSITATRYPIPPRPTYPVRPLELRTPSRSGHGCPGFGKAEISRTMPRKSRGQRERTWICTGSRSRCFGHCDKSWPRAKRSQRNTLIIDAHRPEPCLVLLTALPSGHTIKGGWASFPIYSVF